MIISKTKPIEEILNFLEGKNKLFISGCAQCATVCQAGGEKEILTMKTLLEEAGKVVLNYQVIDPGCNLLQAKKDFKLQKESLEQAEAVLSMACGDGTQTLAKLVKIPVYPANNTMFIGEIERVGHYSEMCIACGDCELGWTGGICPITRCAKGLLNGPCGGSRNGKCETNTETDCAWIEIYNKLGELGQLSNLKKIRPPKDFSTSVKPRKLVIERS